MLDDQDIAIQILEPGSVISNRYEIVRLLGLGAMGSVHLVCDRVLGGNTVAIKVMHPELARDRALTKRFLREVQLMHQVNHQNVIRTYDVGCDGGLIYFTMEYVPGATLAEAMESGSFSISEIEDLVLQISAGLNAIHQAKILHRDLKPGNIIMLDDVQVKIADFGVARPATSSLTQHREIMGSFEYMAPEIWQGRPLTEAVDYYSLGVILYELTTKIRPFDSSEPATMMWMHINSTPEPPITLEPSLPIWLNNLIMNLLSKLPEGRPCSLQEIQYHIKNGSNSLPINGSAIDSSDSRLRNLPAVIGSESRELSSLDDESFPLFLPTTRDEAEYSLIPSVDSSRSAISGIIFRSAPTSDDIRHHEDNVASGTRSRLKSDLETLIEQKKLHLTMKFLRGSIFLAVVGMSIITAQFISSSPQSRSNQTTTTGVLPWLQAKIRKIAAPSSNSSNSAAYSHHADQPLFQELFSLRNSLNDYSNNSVNYDQTSPNRVSLKQRLFGKKEENVKEITAYEFLFGPTTSTNEQGIPAADQLNSANNLVKNSSQNKVVLVPKIDLSAAIADIPEARPWLDYTSELDPQKFQALQKLSDNKNLREIAAEKKVINKAIYRLEIQLEPEILSPDSRKALATGLEKQLRILKDIEEKLEREYRFQDNYYKLWIMVRKATNGRDLLHLAHYLTPLDEAIKLATDRYHLASANYSLTLEKLTGSDDEDNSLQGVGAELQKMRSDLRKHIITLVDANLAQHRENMLELILVTNVLRQLNFVHVVKLEAVKEFDGHSPTDESRNELSTALLTAKERLTELRQTLPDKQEHILRSYHVIQELGLNDSLVQN